MSTATLNMNPGFAAKLAPGFAPDVAPGTPPKSSFAPFCIGCGAKVPPLRATAVACPHCGDELVRANGMRATASPLSPALRALASLLLPGAGQVWNGQPGKGVVVLLTSWLIVPWIYGVVDAWRVSRRRALATGPRTK